MIKRDWTISYLTQSAAILLRTKEVQLHSLTRSPQRHRGFLLPSIIAHPRMDATNFFSISIHAMSNAIQQKITHYGSTAVTSISTLARSSIRPATCTAVMAGKCLPISSR